jgi:hypothetical protein
MIGMDLRGSMNLSRQPGECEQNVVIDLSKQSAQYSGGVGTADISAEEPGAAWFLSSARGVLIAEILAYTFNKEQHHEMVS